MPIDNIILQNLERKNPKLTTLSLSHLKLTDADIVLLAKALANNATLKKLTLEGNQVGDVGAKALSEALAKNETLTELDLRNNQVGDAGAKALSEVLAKNSTLRTLWLNHNQIGDAGTKALSEGLTDNATLTTLNLGVNQVGDVGAKALSEALAKNSTLRTLWLGNNQVGDAGAEALSEGLAKNATLKDLNLHHNKVSNTGAKALGAALVKNATLTTLGLSYNQIGEAGAKMLSEGLAKNATLTMLFLSDNKPGLFSKSITEATQNTINTKVFRNKRLAEKKEKKKESKSSAVPSPEVVTRLNENKNTPIQPIPSSGSTDVKDSVVTPSFSSDVKANPFPSSVLPVPPTSPGYKNPIALDAKILDQLAEQQEAQLLQPPAPEASQESMEALQKKLASMEGKMRHLDGEALTVLQGKAQEVRTLINQATEQRQAEAERNHIESDDCLCDYYYVLRSQLLHMWLACQVIHSEMVDNDKKTKLDYLADNIDKIAVRFPGLSLLTGFIKATASGWSYREKKEAMQHMSAFCLGLVEGDTVIDTLARQLTLSQELTLKAKLAPAKTGTFRKALAVFKKAKNWALVNDIDNATKEFAAKQASQILEAVMKGKIKTPCRSKDVPQLFSLVMGVNAVYQSPIALLATANSSNPNAASNSVNANSPSVGISVQQTQSYSKMQATLNAAPNATAKDEIAELKQWKVEQEKITQEQEKRVKEQEEKMRTMQEELSRVKNQHQTKEPIVQKQDFENLQAEFNHLKAIGSQVQKQDFDNFKRELKKILEQAGIASGDGPLVQTSGAAFGAGTVTSEQRQIAELQQQMRFLTARLLMTQEQQSPEDEAEDPARPKLLI